ncbi:hypothetical protein BU24DRAFT_496168 [Aaosphaeria arxii CBS 175.79]|uniref:Uncharacterized protein n=1 Tax=Aaosphaeria arxii CBS 175.79 TaxID=1450172 RepID=A0A6A5XDZ0_9PLEO|nr:uncharacterized protein BU24DRAFT_496168 [Aaosphaeria arxii CBS 175.79]KAF2011027.1 hypothetical protein BU24DRAFT_496168 [Aaosphaeria arxii CBS 175.79]
MIFKNIALVASTLFTISLASFLVVPEDEISLLPIRTFSNEAAAQTWAAGVVLEAAGRFESYITGPEGRSLASKVEAANTPLQEFVATATYDIPAVVTATETDQVTVYRYAPEWYAALPTEVKEANEELSQVYVDAIKDSMQSGGRRSRSLGTGMGCVVAFVAVLLVL